MHVVGCIVSTQVRWLEPTGDRNVFLIFGTTNRSDLGPTVFCTKGAAGSIPGVNRPSREANRSLPSSAKIMNAWVYTSAPL